MQKETETTDVENKSVGKNALLNVFTTLLRVVFPLITYPYVTRILKVENLGKVNYATSIVSYYALFAALGISTYAVREGSRNRNNRRKTEKFADQVFSINVLSTVLAYIVLGISLIFITKFHDYALLILIESLSILFTTIGVDWINTIYEDYAYIAKRSLIIQIFSLVSLFAFVHKSTDYYIYAIITVASQGIVSVLNILHVRKYCKVRFTWHLHLKRHLKPILVLFSNNLAVSIYVNSDTTMLGWMVGDYYVGLYSVAVRIYTVIKQLLAALYNVMIARLSFYYAQGNIDKFKELLNNAINAIVVMAIPATCGLICVAREVILVISGRDYLPATLSLQILSAAFFFAIMGGLLANCINLPLKREKMNLIATSISAVVNIGFNVVLIPKFYQNAAAFTTFLSEFTVSMILLYSVRDHYDFFDFKSIGINIVKSLISAVPMIVLAYIYSKVLNLNDLAYLALEVITGAGSYLGMNLLLKNQWIYKVKENLTRRNRA